MSSDKAQETTRAMGASDIESDASKFSQSLATYIKAGYPILYVVTPEEDRAIDVICETLQREELKRSPFVWSVTRGLCTMDAREVNRAKTQRPTDILPFLLEFDQPGVFILEDFHFFMDDRSQTAPIVIRQLRDVVRPFMSTGKTVVILSSVLKIPPELEKDVTVADLDLPGEEELLRVLDNTIEEARGKRDVQINVEKGDREAFVQALSGLTLTEAENALYKMVATNRRIDLEDIRMLLAEKEQIIRKSGVLEYYSSPEEFGYVGGLEELKSWLAQRGKAFSEEARLFGLPNPKGLLLVGVPGCGKSLSAKAVAAEWNMPLLRFDLGRVFHGYVGESEETMRKALKTAEGVAPCVLWIDEIEKGLSGVQGQGDGGTSARVFGTLLTWMEENEKPVFTIATANNIDGIPPELLRRGRFDEIFFIDLPNDHERAHILRIHLVRRHRDYRDFDLAEIVRATAGYSGAELEQVIVSALFDAFAEGPQTTLQDKHLLKACGDIKPLSQTLGKKIAEMREKARDWRIASREAPLEPAVAEAMPQAPTIRPPRRRRLFN